ncbi:MAG: hypothetical protein AB2L20_03920 [Mangrovibacterium sp.]
MKLLLSGWIILIASAVAAQDKSDSTFIFSGYIFSEDSVPIENAYLINYRNTKIVTNRQHRPVLCFSSSRRFTDDQPSFGSTSGNSP